MASTVDIVINAKDNASGPIKNVSKTLDGMGSSVQSFVQGARDVGLAVASWGAIAQQALQMAKAVYSFAESGAELELVETRFGRLATSIGTTSDVLLVDLRAATRGLYSDAELMASATDMMALGLAKTRDQAVRLAAVSAGLNMNMNQLVLTLTNMTTMRFDALGVSVDGFKEKVKALQDTGMSAEEAFREAFLQQAEAQLTKVGHAADTTAGQFMQLEAAWKNFTDSMKAGAAEALTPALEAINDQINASQEYNRMLDDMARMRGLSTPEFLKMMGANGEFDQNMKRAIEQYQRAKDETILYKKELDALTGATQANTTATQQNAMTQDQFRESMSNLSDLMRTDLTKAQEGYTKKIADLQAKLKEAKPADRSAIIAQIDEETEAYNRQAKAIMFDIQQKQILQAAESGKITYEQAAAVTTALAQNYGLIDEKTASAITRTQEFINLFAETGNMEAFIQNLSNLGYWAQTSTPLVDDSASSVGEFANKTQLAVDALLALPPSGTVWNYTFNLQGEIPTGTTTTSYGGGGSNNAGADDEGYASGGVVRGPESGYYARLHGTEGVFTREQMAMLQPAGSSQSVNVSITYAPMVSTASVEEFERNITPAVNRIIRKARRQ